MLHFKPLQVRGEAEPGGDLAGVAAAVTVLPALLQPELIFFFICCLQVKIGFYPISWSTFFQLLLFFVGAWGGTFIKILTDIDQKYKHGGVN